MPLSMASLAKGYPVRDFKAHIRKVGPWFDMMGMEVSAAVIAAILASKAIAGVDIESPTLIFNAMPLSAPFLYLAVLIGMACCATHRIFPHRYADFSPGFGCVFFSDSIAWVGFGCDAHPNFRFLGMYCATERRDSSLHIFTNLNTPTNMAFSHEAISTTLVKSIFGLRFPGFARVAMFQSDIDFFKVFRNINSDSGCCCFLSSVSTSHARNV